MRAVKKGYFLGSGIGSLSGAIFMVRDGQVDPKNITIYEALDAAGGSMDKSGGPEEGYMIRGGRMLNYPAYECLWELMRFVPSIENPGKTLWDDAVAFNKAHPTNSRARLVDHNMKRTNVECMGFSMKDRMDLLKMINSSDEELGEKTIIECFESEFFETNFWLMWQTTFAFQTWHSAAELRRYILRFNHEFLRIHTLEGIARTPMCQYDSLVLPMQRWLEERGVKFVFGAVCDDIEMKVDGGKKTVTSFSLVKDGQRQTIKVDPDDIVIYQNGSMTDGAGLGTMTEPARARPSTSFLVWEKLAKIDPCFGTPAPFTRSIKESLWYTFTITINNDTRFFDREVQFSKNIPGEGAILTFKDSNWLMSIVINHQPHFRGQPDTCQVVWGMGLFPDRIGNFVNKTMLECTGSEIMDELIGHFGFDRSDLDGAICRTCVMPYITAQFMTRLREHRPLPVPKGCTNFGMTSQFVEIPDDVVFTVEYSVRAAQMAVYELMNIKKPIPPISHHERELGVKLGNIKQAFKGTGWMTGFKVVSLGLLGLGVASLVKVFLK